MHIDVIFPGEGGQGWAPVSSLATLASRLFGGQTLTMSPSGRPRTLRLYNLRPRQHGTKDAVLLALLHVPSDLHALRASAAFRDGYRAVVVWIIDSYLHEHMLAPLAFRDIDILCYMRPNDEAPFRRAAGDRAMLMGWGADALLRGSGDPNRAFDLVRVGRQPAEWEDDDVTSAACKAVRLRFHGRPEFQEDPIENQYEVMRILRQSRFVVAHSNTAAPAPYTHPTQEYLTARWVDALACGTSVAGIPPRSDKSMQRLLWPEAILAFDRIDLRHNLAAIRAACDAWTPALAALNYRQSLLRLDWRWRLKALADRLSIVSPALEDELARIKHLAAEPMTVH